MFKYWDIGLKEFEMCNMLCIASTLTLHSRYIKDFDIFHPFYPRYTRYTHYLRIKILFIFYYRCNVCKVCNVSITLLGKINVVCNVSVTHLEINEGVIEPKMNEQN